MFPKKYLWLALVALSAFFLEGLIMHLIEVMMTDDPQCRNMNSVNPLKMVSCHTLPEV